MDHFCCLRHSGGREIPQDAFQAETRGRLARPEPWLLFHQTADRRALSCAGDTPVPVYSSGRTGRFYSRRLSSSGESNHHYAGLCADYFQVSNNTPCIKVAMDFLTLDDLPQTVAVAGMLRQDGHTDVLRLTTMLWHAWRSLSQLFDASTTASSRNSLKRSRSEMLQQSLAKRRAKKRSRGVSDKTLRCPDPDCHESNRAFECSGLFNHM